MVLLGGRPLEGGTRHAVATQLAPGHGPQDVLVLGGAVHRAGPVVTGDTVGDVAGDLDDGEPGHEDVDGQADLHPPAVGQGHRLLIGLAAQTSLTGQRRHGQPPGGQRNGPPGGAHDPAATTSPGLLGGNRDGHVGHAVDDRGHQLGAGGGRVPQVGVDEQQQPGRTVGVVAHGDDGGPGLHGGGLPA